MTPPIFRHHGLRSVGFVLRVAEPMLVLVFSVLAYYLRQGFGSEFQAGPAVMTLLVAALYGMSSGGLKMYDPLTLRRMVQAVPRLLVVLSLCFGFVVTLLFLFKISADYSRFWLSVWFGLSLVSLLTLRAFVARTIERRVAKGKWSRKMVILGTNAKAVELLHAHENLKNREIKLVGVYCLSEHFCDADIPPELNKHLKGNFLTLLEHCLQGRIDDVVLTEDLENAEATVAIINRLNTRPVNVMYCLPLGLVSCMGVRGLPLMMISRKPLEGHSVWLKRMLDIAASGAALVLLAPVMAGIAVAVKMTSPGPVFFKQKRGGFNGDDFEMLKFRSMRVGADAMKDKNGKEMQALKNDPRITPVGRFLRKSSLDELPQLINVLRGDMSLVGPRPHVPSHNSYYENLIDTYASRHRMKPGITGWAQLNGHRGETDTLDKMAKRVEFDVWYTQNWSFWLDVKILVLTPFVAFFQKSAY